MTKKEDFDYFWNFFQEEMKKDSKLRFISNRKISDDSFGQNQGYFFTEDVNQHRPGRFGEAMEILLSSGIYGLWKKWEKIRFGPEERKRAGKMTEEENLAEFKIISFQDSDVHLVFLLWVYLLAFSGLSFLLEMTEKYPKWRILWNSWKRKFSSPEKTDGNLSKVKVIGKIRRTSLSRNLLGFVRQRIRI